MLELVKVDYEGQSISFSEDGWFNATAAAERFGKPVQHYLENAETQEYPTLLERVVDDDFTLESD